MDHVKTSQLTSVTNQLNGCYMILVFTEITEVIIKWYFIKNCPVPVFENYLSRRKNSFKGRFKGPEP